MLRRGRRSHGYMLRRGRRSHGRSRVVVSHCIVADQDFIRTPRASARDRRRIAADQREAGRAAQRDVRGLDGEHAADIREIEEPQHACVADRDLLSRFGIHNDCAQPRRRLVRPRESARVRLGGKLGHPVFVPDGVGWQSEEFAEHRVKLRLRNVASGAFVAAGLECVAAAWQADALAIHPLEQRKKRERGAEDGAWPGGGEAHQFFRSRVNVEDRARRRVFCEDAEHVRKRGVLRIFGRLCEEERRESLQAQSPPACEDARVVQGGAGKVMRAACLARRAAGVECHRRGFFRKTRKPETLEHRLRDGGDFAPRPRCLQSVAPACKRPVMPKLKRVDAERERVEFILAQIAAQRCKHARFECGEFFQGIFRCTY